MSRARPDFYTIHLMTEGHVDAALRLCREAGWNQLRQDWRRLIGYEPKGCFVAISEGQLIGTVTTTRYGRKLAWIGMMLVHPHFRRLGIASSLMRTSIDYLRHHGVRCIKLDATPAGQRVYQKLGFEAEWTLQRWYRSGNTDVMESIEIDITPLSDAMRALDRRAFGADRSAFLECLRRDSIVLRTQDGFGMLRPGFLAAYLGPSSAITAEAAERILAELCVGTPGGVFWDIPSPNSKACQLARSLRFSPVRALTRMRLGNEARRPDLSLQFALADPGTG